jgi:hypothetical protein
MAKVWLVVEFWYDDNECDNHCRTFTVNTYVAASHEVAQAWVNRRAQYVNDFSWNDSGMSAKGFMHEWEITETVVAVVAVAVEKV